MIYSFWHLFKNKWKTKGKASEGWERFADCTLWLVSRTERFRQSSTHKRASCVSSSPFLNGQIQSWHSSRLTPTVRQMELRGARQRPGRPCQLIWPGAQPYSISTAAVNIQLRVVSVLLTVSVSSLLQMTVVLDTPRSSLAWWVHVPITALCGWTGVPWHSGRPKLPHLRGLCTTGVVRESARSSCHPSDCQADPTGLRGVPRSIFYSASRSDLNCHLTMSLTSLTLQ